MAIKKLFARRRKNNPEDAQSRSIDAQLQEAHFKDELSFRILLLGAGESGKSTVVKQLRHIHKGKASMSDEEIMEYKQVLHMNTLQSVKILLKASSKFELKLLDKNSHNAEAILKHGDRDVLTLDDAVCIEALWNDPAVQEVYTMHKHEIYFPDAGKYYFDNVYRFVERDFVPSEEDIVMARKRTTGMFETDFYVPPVHWNVADVGGQRNERKKWVKFFDNVQAIMFVVNLAGYNRVLFEDQTKNRMQEALELFHQIVNTSVFAETPTFLFLNKKDLFEEMLRMTNIDIHFKDYSGPQETRAAIEFIIQKFVDCMPKKKKIDGVFVISARVKQDVRGSFSDVKKTLLKINKKKVKQAVKHLSD